MTPTFCCGFECGQHGSVGQHWRNVVANGTVTFDTTTKRSGARSMRFNTSAQQNIATTPSVMGTARHVVRFYIRFATLPDTTISLYMYSGNNNGPNVRFNQSDNKIYAAVGSTLGASGVTVTTGVWYRIDCDFNVDTGGADFCDVKVDGTACGQATATGTSSGDSADSFGMTTNCTTDFYVDDYVCSETAADYPIGAGKVEHFVPTADGTHNVAGANDFERGTTGTDIINSTTNAFELIDDVPLDDTTPDTNDFINMIAPPGAGDYVECVFGPAPGISTPTAGPRAVEVIAGIHQAGTTTGNMEIRINDNGTTDAMYSATGVAGTTTLTYKRKHYATAIAGGGAWVVGGGGNGDFTDLRVRFGSPAVLDVNPDQYLDCIMVEAEFSEAPAQDVTAPTLASTAATFVATLAYAVTLPTIASGALLNAPTITVGDVSATTPHIASTATLTAPSVAYTVAPPSIAVGSATTAPTVAAEVNAPHRASTVALFAPALPSVDQSVTTAHLASTAALTSPSVAYTVELPMLGSTATLTAPAMAFEVNAPHLASTAALTAPALAYTVTTPTLASGVVLNAPTVAAGAVTLEPPTIGSTVALNAPSVTIEGGLALPTIGSTVALTAPTVAAGAVTLTGAHIASTAALTAPSASYAVTAPAIASTATLNAPSVSAGDITITLPAIGSTVALVAPSVGPELQAATIASTASLTAPTVAVGEVTLALPFLTSTVIYPPTIEGGATIAVLTTRGEVWRVAGVTAATLRQAGVTAATWEPD